mmetsp:Transcript_33720/g.33986  ORF Transcript_33720/g.33986 Transcript_33720/m.33986 type:complete len:84 (-) Transcript_33720:23-274(-)
MVHLTPQKTLGRFFHLAQYHGRNLLGCKFLLTFLIRLDLNHGFSPGTVHNPKREQTLVFLHGGIHEFPSDETFHIKHGVGGVL